MLTDIGGAQEIHSLSAVSPGAALPKLTNVDLACSLLRHSSMKKTLALLPAMCCVPIAAETIDDADAEATAAVFKALADPHRVRIVNLLATSSEPVCVCDLTAVVGLSQPTVSFHLKKLSLAGLINREERGTWSYYSLNNEVFSRLNRIFRTTIKRGVKR